MTILCPFWGRRTQRSTWPDYADELIRVGPEFLELSDLAGADIAVFPMSCRPLFARPDGLELAQRFDERTKQAGKLSVFFYDGADTSYQRFPIEGAVVVRGSIYRSRRGASEFALPGFHDDLTKYTGGELPIRHKSGRPVVSFCGALIREYPPSNALGRARRLVGDVRRSWWRAHGRHEEDLWIRAKAVDALDAQEKVGTSFVLRASGGGGTWDQFDEKRWQEVRREYVENMVGADYTLCARGDGNWSFRFYESLCLGRIPVFVDSDCVLPYEFLVDWRDYVVWISRDEVPTIGERIAAFHEQLSDREFVDLQRECRRLWEEWLSPQGFFRNFHRHFDFGSTGVGSVTPIRVSGARDA
ncbi:MAG TPA: exostosin family protein [Gaiellaceae bacterium]|nr:exostosin family protein [Gaiellaceae bacterium]